MPRTEDPFTGDPLDPKDVRNEVRNEVRRWLPTGFLGFLLAVVIAALAVGVVFGMIKLFQPAAQSIDTSNQKHQIQVNQIKASANNVNIGTQNSYVQQAETSIGAAISAGPGSALGAYDAGNACLMISNIVIGMPVSVTQFYAENCDGTNLSQASKYYVAP